MQRVLPFEPGSYVILIPLVIKMKLAVCCIFVNDDKHYDVFFLGAVLCHLLYTVESNVYYRVHISCSYYIVTILHDLLRSSEVIDI